VSGAEGGGAAMREVARNLAWCAVGTELLSGALDRLGDDELDGPSVLPGWSRRHVLAHLACNAEGLQRLASWARTGEETPMYASMQQRERDIVVGSARPAGELRAWVAESAAALAKDLDALPDAAWSAQVRTSQGRLVPAVEISWLRVQELFVHSIDLDAGVGFADLPADVCQELLGRVAQRRSAKGDGPALAVHAEDAGASWQVTGSGEPVPVSAPSAVLAAWLTGRPVQPPPGPALPPWL
jgi:maleylpyruvate isomerase